MLLVTHKSHFCLPFQRIEMIKLIFFGLFLYLVWPPGHTAYMTYNFLKMYDKLFVAPPTPQGMTWFQSLSSYFGGMEFRREREYLVYLVKPWDIDSCWWLELAWDISQTTRGNRHDKLFSVMSRLLIKQTAPHLCAHELHVAVQFHSSLGTISSDTFFIYVSSNINYVIIKCVSNEGFKFTTSTVFSLPRDPFYTIS